MDPKAVGCTLRMPGAAGFPDQIMRNAQWAYRMLQADTRAGQSVAIYGAGPSLRTAPISEADERWACNGALPFLMDRGAPITHGVTVDQGSAMLGPSEWFRTFDVEYLLASSVHPDLVQHLANEGRRWAFFHSFIGMTPPPHWTCPSPLPSSLDPSQPMGYEEFLYRRLYPQSVLVGQGLNTGCRAVCLALVMGFSRIDVYGMDCATAPHTPMPPRDHPAQAAWLNGCVLYADGRTVGQLYGDTPMAEAELNGRLWHTRPDMIASALHLLGLQKLYPGRIVFHGDTLVNALADSWEDPDFMDGMPTLNDDGTMTNFDLPTAFVEAGV